MNTPPKICVILDLDGTLDDVSVLAKDQRTRVVGFHLIEQLSEELQIFEARIKMRIEHLKNVQ